MGWLDWFNDSSGGETNSKTEKNSNGSKDTHYISVQRITQGKGEMRQSFSHNDAGK